MVHEILGVEGMVKDNTNRAHVLTLMTETKVQRENKEITQIYNLGT